MPFPMILRQMGAGAQRQGTVRRLPVLGARRHPSGFVLCSARRGSAGSNCIYPPDAQPVVAGSLPRTQWLTDSAYGKIVGYIHQIEAIRRQISAPELLGRYLPSIPGLARLHRMKRGEINLPDETFAGLDRDSAQLAADLRAAAAAKWYEVGRVSQEVAAQIAGVSRSEFISILSDLNVSPMQESAEEALAGAELLRQP